MPSNCLSMPRKLLVGGLHRSGTLKGTIKKVAPPLVPEVVSNRLSGSSFSSGYASQSTADRNSCGSLVVEDLPLPDGLEYNNPSPSPTTATKFHFPEPPPQCQTIVYADVHAAPDSPYGCCRGKFDVDQGIDVHGGGRDSPGGSSGGGTSRHSTSSLDSGRGSEPKPARAGNDRHSYHSSSSSLGSADTDTSPPVNVAEMMLHGVPDLEILTAWLSSLHFDEYVNLFIQAGYDMPTISRMTPEDLTAIGITKPNHRRKLKAEIARLNISDGIPDFKPDSLLTWLQILHLGQYFETLCRQNYTTVDKVAELTWEDLEDIGIKKLGHQKRIMLAIKKIEDLNKRPNPVCDLYSSGISELPHPLPRPSNLGTNHIPCYHLQGHEVAITTPVSPIAPEPVAQELKTFLPTPPSPHHFYTSQPRGHSLESLDMDDSVSMMHGDSAWYEWRPSYGYDTVHEGTASLHRPKGLIKPKPVAKIIAKTRPPEIDMLKGLNIDSPCKLLTSNHSVTQLYGTLRHKRNPPPPPKRTNSIKATEANSRSLEAIKDEAFATCVKGLTSRFSMATHEDEIPYDFPPPPCESAKDDLLELSKLRQRRKDSSDSLVSIASTDSNSLPFANENVGTIKQRTGKPYPNLEACANSLRRATTIQGSNYKCDVAKSDQGDTKTESLKKPDPGDVIDDIENMLVNLSHQLDAMLEDEMTSH